MAIQIQKYTGLANHELQELCGDDPHKWAEATRQILFDGDSLPNNYYTLPAMFILAIDTSTQIRVRDVFEGAGFDSFKQSDIDETDPAPEPARGWHLIQWHVMNVIRSPFVTGMFHTLSFFGVMLFLMPIAWRIITWWFGLWGFGP